MADFYYTGRSMDIDRDHRFIVPIDVWMPSLGANVYPLFPGNHPGIPNNDAPIVFVSADANDEPSVYLIDHLRRQPRAVLLLSATGGHTAAKQMDFIRALRDAGLTTPVVLHNTYTTDDDETFQVQAGADCGAVLLSGMGDGLWLEKVRSEASSTDLLRASYFVLRTSFAILQAARLRTTATEFISCPSCGRTLFDLQSTVKKVKAATSHLTHLKIAVMGCIVNGPGEMADADYGYVGAAPGRVSLYHGKQLVEANIPTAEAIPRLIALIKQCGDWI